MDYGLKPAHDKSTSYLSTAIFETPDSDTRNANLRLPAVFARNALKASGEVQRPLTTCAKHQEASYLHTNNDRGATLQRVEATECGLAARHRCISDIAIC